MNDNKIYSLQLTRVLSSIVVVFIYGMSVAKSYVSIDSGLFTAASAIQNVLNFVVPLFIMVSGALLLNPNRTMTFDRLFKHYIAKALILLAIFNLINTIFDGIRLSMPFGEVVKSVFVNFISGSGWAHMWYLYMLIAMYLTLPVIRIFVKNANAKTSTYMMGCLFVIGSLIPTLTASVGSGSGFYMWTNSIYLFYFLAGFYIFSNRYTAIDKFSVVLDRINKLKKNAKWVLIALFCVALFEIIILSIGKFDSNVSSFASLFTLVMTLIAFWFINTRGWQNNTVISLVKKADETTMGVYLFGMLFMKIMFALYNPMQIGFVGFLIVFIYCIFSYALSFTATFLINMALQKANLKI